MISITNFKDILISKSGGKPLSKVSNFYSICYQAMIKVKAKVDLPSSMRTVQLTNPVYTAINNYPIPVDASLDAISMIRPITPDITYIDFTNINGRQLRTEQKFSTLRKLYALRNINGIQTLLINDVTTEPVVVHNCESVTANGTITAVGATTNVVANELQKVVGNASIGFDVGAGASNGLEDTGMTSVDLSEQNDILYFLYVPSITNLTGVRLSLGQSAGAYNQATVTTDFFGNALAQGWNLLRIAKTSFAVGAGVPTWTGVVYFKLEILGTYVTPVTGWALDSIVGQIGALYEIDYYSDYQFVDLSGARIIKPSADTDSILISGDEIDLFLDQFIELMAVDLKQQGVAVEYQVYGGTNLKIHYEEFKLRHPSERQLMTTQYASRPRFDR